MHDLHEGHVIRCPTCRQSHRLQRMAGTMPGLLFYPCRGEMQLGAISGRPCVGVVPIDATTEPNRRSASWSRDR